MDFLKEIVKEIGSELGIRCGDKSKELYNNSQGKETKEKDPMQLLTYSQIIAMYCAARKTSLQKTRTWL